MGIYGLEEREAVGDKLIMVAKDPDDHRDWHKILPKSTPLYLHTPSDLQGTLVRWAMPKEDAQSLGYWGIGCACCGVGGETGGDTWYFDTELPQVEWYLRGLVN